ncbi:alpha/beta fold hydrolase [Saccharopolyspora mangrovi]|uniref:Alpha/beta fold hydrolase n=1 Tax=Saccharopolyspora mangrovi TaxID=3082379 RepID=A0ABU6AJ46_9PSEU|nr:alpha/beta fold hydrolase [Saccharopolyspora sp. S2-29]MEB3371560.1 alpha/beta fold hydrolase [Saccharopolyspora sp. S2-29]
MFARFSECISTADGVELAVYGSGDPAHPTAVFVHGFPDDHRVWVGLTPLLAADHHVVTYDVRGSGASAKPRRIADYRLEVLAADLQAVIDHVNRGQGVHLVGHDWGSVQGWHLITDPGHRGVLSYTSISGPCIDHVRGWIGRRARARQWGAIAALWKSPLYMGALQVPMLAPLMCRLGVVDLMAAGAVTAFERPEDLDPWPVGPNARANGAAVRMYAANLLRRLSRSDRGGTSVPVQILTPTSDVFIPPVSQQDPHPDVRTVRVEPVVGGHWAPAYNPSAITSHLEDWITQQQTRQAREPER